MRELDDVLGLSDLASCLAEFQAFPRSHAPPGAETLDLLAPLGELAVKRQTAWEMSVALKGNEFYAIIYIAVEEYLGGNMALFPFCVIFFTTDCESKKIFNHKRKGVSMRVVNKAIISGLFAVGLSTAASASTLDFYGYAGAGEHGVANGTAITSASFGGETVTFSSTSTHANPSYAYFDYGAGLGVCNVLTASFQCDPGNDDNLQSGETVTFSLAGLFDLSGIVLRAEGHGFLGDAVSVLIDVGNGWQEFTYGDLKNESFSGISAARFGYGGTTADQYYVSSATVSAVPLPAAAGLLIAGLGGLGGLGFVGRRKRKQAA